MEKIKQKVTTIEIALDDKIENNKHLDSKIKSYESKFAETEQRKLQMDTDIENYRVKINKLENDKK